MPSPRVVAMGLAAALAAWLAPVATAQVGGSQACAPQAAPTQVGVQPARICRSAADLNDLLRSPYTGRVIIPSDARWEMRGRDGQPLTYIPLRSGVELVGQRGALGSRPLLYAGYRAEGYPLFVIEGNDVRVEGLHLRGPYLPRDRKQELPGVHAIEVIQDSAAQLGRRIVISGNEVEGFSVAAEIGGTIGTDEPADYDQACEPRPCPHPEPGDAALVRVERNYLHNNAMAGGGYGVVRRRRRLRPRRGQRVRVQQSLGGRGRAGVQRLRGSLQLRPQGRPHRRQAGHLPPQLRRAREVQGRGARVRGRPCRHLLRRLLQHGPRRAGLRLPGAPDARRLCPARPARAGRPVHGQRPRPRRLRRRGEAEARGRRPARRGPAEHVQPPLGRQPLRHRLLHRARDR